ncbi:ABA3 [Acanthosepion pharaonis]|uniref:ABA3 n=1 Tax=Acanthosepion pharaonis TaxID=158019 RepID=A0A812AK17_ACAPH|nr:ABA3 [Sepia pharaonis]
MDVEESNKTETDGGCFCYLLDNHTSVQGMREIAIDKRAKVICLNTDQLYQADLSDAYLQSQDGNNNRGNSLFVYPAQSNFSGHRYPLDWIADVKSKKFPFQHDFSEDSWFTCLDAASFVSTSHLDLQAIKPDFLAISFFLSLFLSFFFLSSPFLFSAFPLFPLLSFSSFSLFTLFPLFSFYSFSSFLFLLFFLFPLFTLFPLSSFYSFSSLLFFLFFLFTLFPLYSFSSLLFFLFTLFPLFSLFLFFLFFLFSSFFSFPLFSLFPLFPLSSFSSFLFFSFFPLFSLFSLFPLFPLRFFFFFLSSVL